jgi:hypothetical protein
MARPYILEPDFRLTVGLYSQPTQQGTIGEVTSADWVGMRQREVGQGQAWLYSEDRTLVLWECFLEHWYRNDDPRTDDNLKAVWLGFEEFLLRHLPQQIDHMVTPSWEPLYNQDKQAWPDFLEQVGFRSIAKRAFGKEVSPQPR